MGCNWRLDMDCSDVKDKTKLEKLKEKVEENFSDFDDDGGIIYSSYGLTLKDFVAEYEDWFQGCDGLRLYLYCMELEPDDSNVIGGEKNEQNK